MAEVHPSKVKVNIEDISTKQRNAILSIISDIDFTPVEISELIVEMGGKEEPGEAEEKTDL